MIMSLDTGKKYLTKFKIPHDIKKNIQQTRNGREKIPQPDKAFMKNPELKH